jgi:hypothetical protein
MGVCLVSYAVSDANIDTVLADPPLIWRIVEPEDESSYLRELEREAKVSVWARLLGKTRPAPEVRHLKFTAHELRPVDLDKSWDGLNACLKVCAPQVPNFFGGSGEVGKIEVGYSAALYHRSDTMQRIAQAYAGVTAEQLLTTFRSLDLTRSYPRGMWQQGDAAIESYLTENLAELQAFVKHTRDHALGAIIQFT